jgi:protein-tyrosine phosphatase
MEYQPDPEKFPGVRVLQCPFMDDDDPEIFPEAMLLTCAKIAAYQVHAGNKVLVTCQMGWNRSGIVTALTLYRLYKITGQEALEAVRNARPHALSNEFFADYLRKLPLR